MLTIVMLACLGQAPAEGEWATPPQPAAPAPLGTSQRSCNSSLDCGSGGWCRDRGDGLKVCMNSGQHGDSCQSALDCGSGGFCKDRGDGMKVCMSHGGAGAPCSSSLDWGSGMFCRGDQIKTCQ